MEIDMRYFTYDTWGRIDTIVYSDGEIVIYGYDYGGQLISVKGDKAGNTYQYLYTVTYNKFGAKIAQTYGNQLTTYWQYNPYNQRLEKPASLHIKRGTLSVNFGFPVIVAGLFAHIAREAFFSIPRTRLLCRNIGGSEYCMFIFHI